MAGSEDLLKDTVFQLLGHQQSYDHTYQEILSLKQLYDNKTDVDSLTCWDWFPASSTHSGTDSSNVLNTVEVCWKRLLTLSSVEELGPEQNDELDILVNVLQQLQGNSISSQRHTNKLLSECPNIPAEIIWTLHKKGVFSLDSYIQMLAGKKSGLEDFICQLITLKEERLPQLTSELVCEMICIVFTGEDTGTSQNKKRILQVVDKIVLGLVDMAVDGRLDKPDSMLEFKLLLDLETKKKVYTHLLNTILCHNPVMKVSQAIREQAKWSYGKISPALTQLYKQILLAFDVTETLTLIREILENQEVNWQLILSLVSEVVVCMPESSKHFLDFIDDLLREGLENSEFETTIMGMLLARQACFQGPHVFLSYNDWFQRSFADSSRSLASSRKSFTFLMKFLTNLMPYESANHIKVHILRPPCVPTKCRQILTDYITLAKTRLADLKESLDTQVNEDSENLTGKANAGISVEVENAIKLFEATRKVPTSVLESSIFRKPYYIGQFLPSLLTPRPLPDFPDSRMKLIEALKKADKIPLSMHNTYQKACKKEASQLLEGVFIDSDSDCDMELSPLEQLDVTLQQFVQTVKAECVSEKSKYSISEVISLLCERLENIPLIKRDTAVSVAPSLSLNTQNMDKTHVQIVDKLLHCVAQCLHECFTTKNPVLTWVPHILSSICMFAHLPETLYRRIWTLIITQGASLESHHIDCLSVLLVEIHHQNDRLPLVTTETGSPKSLTEHIVDSLCLRTSQEMEFGLRFYGSCLKYMFSRHDNVEQCLTLPGIVKRFMYLATRLHPYLRYHGNEDDSSPGNILSAVYTSDVFQKLANVLPLTFEEWIEYEIIVCPDKDSLTDFQRHEYFSWIIYRYFLPRHTDNQTVYYDIATCIVKEILHIESCASKTDHVCSKCTLKQPSAVLSNSSSVMIQLLYEMTQMFVCSDQGRQLSGSLPWLPQQLVTMLISQDSEIQKHSTVQHFFRLCFGLPPYLMFTDFLDKPVSMETMTSVVDFINTTVRLYMCKGLYLPIRPITYFLQGMLQIRNIHSTTDVCQYVLQTCPLMLVSIVVHAGIVRPLVHHLLDKKHIVLHMLKSCRDGDYSGIQDPWQLSVMLFSNIVNTTSPRDHHTSFWNDIIRSLASKQKQVLRNLVQMLLLQLTYVTEYMEPKDYGLGEQIMNSLSEILNHVGPAGIAEMLFVSECDMDNNLTMCSQDKLVKLKNFTILKFLKNKQIFRGNKLNGPILNGVLQALTDCNNLFDKSEDLHVSLCGNEMCGLNDYVLSLIAATERSVLCKVDQDLLLQAGPMIADCAIKIMSS